MTTQEEWMEIQLLHRQGDSIREIARKTGMSRNTVRRALRQAVPQPYKPVLRESLLDAYKSSIRERYAACDLSGVRLAEEVRAMGYTGSVVTLRRFVRELKPDRIVRQELTVRFETPPGEQAPEGGGSGAQGGGSPPKADGSEAPSRGGSGQHMMTQTGMNNSLRAGRPGMATQGGGFKRT